jgi:putative lipoprotein
MKTTACVVVILLFAVPSCAALKQELFQVNSTEPVLLADSLQRWQPAKFWPRDSWFGQDKANHFLVSLMLSSSAYFGLTAGHLDSEASLLSAIGGTLALGITKEIWDMIHPGTPSWKDFTADAVGALVGGLAAKTIY